MLWILIAAAVCAGDLLVKHYIDTHKEENCHEPVVGGHIIITRFHNPGAMLGWMKDKPKMLMGVTILGIGVLAGGEKALTAIALLFAIQSLKPSPFCLLDEIEAALDDANVKRFAEYLHNLTKDTQFIVITHRRGTMNTADILYGITMQEKGVSTLVSVNLIENELGK